ncbi:MAG: hypothetical protein RLY97_1696 [Pseudomonadota bacterium]|jgi:Protein of unknown function (DUF1761)
MRVAGLNLVAVLGAAVAIYMLGFVIYGLLVTPDSWMAMAGISKEAADAVGMTRMPFSPLMPLATAIGMAVLFQWANVSGAGNGAKWGLLVAMLSALPALWYGWVYGVAPVSGTLLDSGHLLAGHALAGAILARWR